MLWDMLFQKFVPCVDFGESRQCPDCYFVG